MQTDNQTLDETVSEEIVSTRSVIDLRKRIGLSVREFSRFLGFGEQTAARYERGSVPDTLHSNTIRLASDADGARLLLALNRRQMREESIRLVEDYIAELKMKGKQPNLIYSHIASATSGED